MEDCIFCKIVTGEIPSYKIYEDEHTYAFLTAGPINDGHTLVIPKRHSQNVLTMSPDDFQKLSATVHTLAPVIKEAMHADGMNIIFNCEAAAGQEVFHTHAHLAPRFINDGYHWWGHGELNPATADTIAEQIRKAL